LIESIITGQTWNWAVIGIGLNLNQSDFPDELPNAVSLRQINGVRYEPVDIARNLATGIRERISILHKNSDQILLEFNNSLYKKDQIISFRNNDEIFVSFLKGVDANGCIITEDGIFKPGEVEWIFKV
jgi:BirA family biotin operon repressor/biotin-[acetyl-CoA-carboxylase] ligase